MKMSDLKNTSATGNNSILNSQKTMKEGIKPLRLVLYSNKLTIWWHI